MENFEHLEQSIDCFVEKLIDCLPPSPQHPWVIACSGGPDSVALSFLLHHALKNLGYPAHALCLMQVDHDPKALEYNAGLYVKHIARSIGAQCCNIQLHAGYQSAHMREQRYKALYSQSIARHARCIFTAHQQDDQIETFHMRKERCSHAYGLAGISTWRCVWNLPIIRPLLQCPKLLLTAWLEHKNIIYVTDPTNHDLQKQRNRWRDMLHHASPFYKHAWLNEINIYAQQRWQHDLFAYNMLKKQKIFTQYPKSAIHMSYDDWQEILQTSGVDWAHHTLTHLMRHVGGLIRKIPPRYTLQRIIDAFSKENIGKKHAYPLLHALFTYKEGGVCIQSAPLKHQSYLHIHQHLSIEDGRWLIKKHNSLQDLQKNSTLYDDHASKNNHDAMSYLHTKGLYTDFFTPHNRMWSSPWVTQT